MRTRRNSGAIDRQRLAGDHFRRAFAIDLAFAILTHAPAQMAVL
jgi:hypothetical protein